MTGTLTLIRHGQSQWNADNRFTGWVDVPLSSQGIDEALKAGHELADQPFDAVYTSTLMRAQHTAMLVMSQNTVSGIPIMQHPDNAQLQEHEGIHDAEAEQNRLPVYVDWRLNERYYGALQGLNKDAAREHYGEAQIHIWRRSYDVPPPEGESLAMTCERTLPCLHERILPDVQKGKNILVAAHGNSLRSIVMDLERISQDAILKLEIATGVPRCYRCNDLGELMRLT